MPSAADSTYLPETVSVCSLDPQRVSRMQLAVARRPLSPWHSGYGEVRLCGKRLQNWMDAARAATAEGTATIAAMTLPSQRLPFVPMRE